MHPSSELFDIAKNEPRVDLFLCFMSGRLTNDAETAQYLVDCYKDWKYLTNG